MIDARSLKTIGVLLTFLVVETLVSAPVPAEAQGAQVLPEGVSQFDLGSFDFGSTQGSDSGRAPGSGVASAGGGAPGSSGATGEYGSAPSRSYESSQTKKTATQSVPSLMMTQVSPLDRVFGGGRALPPTRLDSFVRNSGGMAELIYGDEGTTTIPPFFGFSEAHRLERGMYSPGLTTGHKSGLPDAWGWPQ